MTFELTITEAAALEAEFLTAQAQGASAVGAYVEAYNLLFSYITIDDEPASGVDPGAWLFLRGAADVNSGSGDYAAFIRAYTKEQYALRLGNGTQATNTQVQVVSNKIAEKILLDVLNYQNDELGEPPFYLPTINDIAVHDASAAAEELFTSTQIAGWAGNPLFVLLGHTDSFNEKILHQSGGDPKDAYDLLSVVHSMIVAANAVGTASTLAQAFNVLIDIIPGAQSGGAVADALAGANAFLEEAYFGFDLIDLAFKNLIVGTTEANILFGSSSDDLIHGGAGNDVISGLNDNDLIDGGDGNDTLIDGLGNDVLYGGVDETIVIGQNLDTFVITREAGAFDVIMDFEIRTPTDAIGPAVFEKIDLREFGYIHNENDLKALNNNNFNLYGANPSAPEIGYTIYNLGNGQRLALADTNPYLDGSTWFYLQYSPRDVMFIFYDYVAWQSGANYQSASANDVMIGSSANESFDVGSGINYIDAGSGNDSLTISSYNVAIGGDGSDSISFDKAEYATVIGGLGQDFYTGSNASHITYVFDSLSDSTDSARETISASGVTDTIDLTGLGFTTIASGSQTGATLGYTTISGGFRFDDGDSDFSFNVITNNINNITFTYSGGGIPNVTVGTMDDDSLAGSSGNDSLMGGQGADTISAGDGDDTISGGTQGDLFVFVQETSASDTIIDFETDRDVIDLSDISFSGIDEFEDLTISDDSGDAIIEIGDGHEIRLTGVDFESLTADNFFFSAISGTSGADTVTGTANADVLLAGDGADTIIGGSGNDTMTGGNGADIYEMIHQASARDVITDFAAGTDVIDLSDASFAGIYSIGQLHLGNNYTGDAVLDLGGGHTITLKGVDYTALDSGDFIFDTAPYNVIEGTTGANSITGTSGADMIFGLGGTDTIIGGNGNDTVYGGIGDDIITGGDGNDQILGIDGTNSLSGNAGQDTLVGGLGVDTFIWTSLSDSTTAAKDLVSTFGSGIDFLDMNIGANGIGAGADQFTLTFNSTTLETIVAHNSLDFAFRLMGSSSLSSSDFLFRNSDGTLISTLTGNNTVSGGSGVDYLNGGDGNDVVSGDDGDDFLFGGSGTNTLSGEDGNDAIYGGSGVDSIAGGDGDDTLTGGSSIDTFAFELEANASDVITDFVQGLDRIDLSDSSLSAIDDIGDLSLSDDDGDAIVELGSDHTIRLVGVDYTTLVGADFGLLTVVTGTSGADNLTGTWNFDSISGGDGADTIAGAGGDDTLTGGNGVDTFVFELEANTSDVITDFVAGTDWIDLSDSSLSAIDDIGDLSLSDDSGDAIVQLGSSHTIRLVGVNYTTLQGADFGMLSVINGTSGADSLTGTWSFDSISGGNGNDTINGAGGTDTIVGGNNNDSLSGGDGADVIYGDADADTLNGNDGNDTLDGGTGNDVLSGGNDNDSLFGGDNNDTLLGGAGNDTLDGGNGTDVLDGGAGDDLITMGSGDYFVVEGDGGSDTIYGSSGAELILGEDYATVFTGGTGADGNDDLYGYGGNDTISAGQGTDEIWGGDGNDELYGGSGADTFYFTQQASASDVIFDFTYGGADVINLIDASFSAITDLGSLSLSDSSGDAIIQLGSSHTLRLDGVSYTTLTASHFAFYVNVVNGTSSGDSITGTSSNDSISGGIGNDTIDGGAGHDTILGGNDNDSLTGGTGTDTIFGDSGADTLRGGNDSDTLSGGDGNDAVHGDDGNDSLSGGDGNDLVVGGNGNDTIDGGAGTDTLDGGAGDDLITMGSGDYFVVEGDGGSDTIHGSSGGELILGEDYATLFTGGTGADGGDDLYGYGGNDTIAGGQGADEIWAGDGNDELYGGTGADIFYFTQQSSASDVIFDFTHGTDVINLNDVSLDAINGIGDLSLSDSSGDAIIQLGNSHAIRLDGVDYTTLTSGDFAFY